MVPSDRKALLTTLRAHEAQLRAYDVKRLAVFGSFARDEAGESSDVDLLVEFGELPTFRRYMGLKLWLEELLGRPVDLVTPKALRAELRDQIERELLHVA